MATAKLAIEQTLETALAIADGLIAAHKANVIHRDLKPGNIFLLDRLIPDFDLQDLEYRIASMQKELKEAAENARRQIEEELKRVKSRIRCSCPGCKNEAIGGEGFPYCISCDDSDYHLHCSQCDETNHEPPLPPNLPDKCDQCGADFVLWSGFEDALRV